MMFKLWSASLLVFVQNYTVSMKLYYPRILELTADMLILWQTAGFYNSMPNFGGTRCT